MARRRRGGVSAQARNPSVRLRGLQMEMRMRSRSRRLALVIVISRGPRRSDGASRVVPNRRATASRADVEEHEGGFCRRTHVTWDSFSTPASRRRAFVPTRRPTPPLASLDQHPAGRDWSARRGGLVGDRPATRGFYGNGGGVARDNLVIGIAGGGNERADRGVERPGARRRPGMAERT